MSYLGRRGASAALTSADIPNDSITAAKIVDGAVTSDLVYLENATTTQNLSGTYSTERMYLNDSYTLTGDVTITGHLALGTIADADVVITQDSTERTITGSGTLESGDLLHRPDTSDLTGMTGELGSAVTGSPNLNLGNATFPAGHVIHMKHKQYAGTTASMTSGTVDTMVEITLTSAEYVGGSKIYVWAEYGLRYTGWGGRMRLIRSAPGSDVILSDNTNSIAAVANADNNANGCLIGENVITAGDADHRFVVQCVHTAGTQYYNGGGSTAGKFNITAMVVV